MNENEVVKTLVSTKSVEKVYDDILSEPSKKAGNALGTIVNIGNTLLWPVKWVNERTRIYFENNLRKYEDKLKNIPEEKIITVPTEISMPILDRFTYVSNEEISNAFVQLLANASSIDTINKAHPSFIHIIDRLSPDEALLLKYVYEEYFFVHLTIAYTNKDIRERLLNKKTNIRSKINLTLPQNDDIYIDNILSLGLISDKDFYYSLTRGKNIQELVEKDFEEIISLNDSQFKKYYEENNVEENNIEKKEEIKGMYEITEYGRFFINACLCEK